MPGKPFILAFFIWALAAAALTGCREKPWDPQVAVVVNGQSIPTSALDRVLELGFHPLVTDSGSRDPDLNLTQILDKLIDEKLILEQAAQVGVTVQERELEEAMERLGTAWFGHQAPPAERGEMKEALRNQLILRKMTERIIRENLVLSAEGWRKFWEGWPRQRPMAFKLRLLVIPPVREEPSFPARSRQSLDDMTEHLAREGLNILVTDPIWTTEARLTDEETAAINEALKTKRPTKAFRHPESWIVYEALEADGGPDEAEELLRAKEAFEELEGEKVFRAWLAGLRSEADIRINPVYLEIAEPQLGEDSEN